MQALFVQHVQPAQRLAFGFVQAAGPKAALRIALAVVEAQLGGVIGRSGQALQVAAPLSRPVNAVPKGHDQAAPAQRRDAAGLLGHRPVLDSPLRLQALDRDARQPPPGNVQPVQALLLRMPKRRLAQAVGLGGDGGPRRCQKDRCVHEIDCARAPASKVTVIPLRSNQRFPKSRP